ncbi:tripartite tricarboxylate transporter TctB family protein [Cohaesibacter celericrescens]|uniref:tripartite tricarboxylate transporter TctB family protein n=1 Tax=Cohaesibacter celericrescens TaxID=2067669 RepID=UPI0035654C6A
MHLDMTKADRIMAILLALLGLAMLIGGYQMDRLEIRQIHPASIPGLVPMILGGLLVLCAFLLFSSAVEEAKQQDHDEAVELTEEDRKEKRALWRNLIMCALWSVVFALLLVGNMPFVIACGLYISVFYAIFATDEPVRSLQPKAIALLLVKAVALGAVASIAISSLFRYGFLVRLP